LLSLPSPARQRIFNGKQHQSEEERAFVQRIEERCRAVSTTRISPIYVGIQDAIEQLRVLQPQVAERLLTVISDLRENVDPRLRKALTQPLGTRSPLPQPVNNVGVTITLCGYAQTRANQSIQADRLIEVWTQLFTDPSRVSFGPFCPTAGEDIHQ